MAEHARPGRQPVDRRRIAWLVFGGVAFAGGTLLGWNAGLLDAVVRPPAVIGAALVGASAVTGLVLLAAAIRRIEAGRSPALPAAPVAAAPVAAAPDATALVSLIRGVRYVFLAVAAFSAGAGWLLGHPLPLIVALVIAGVDVLETTLLLLVVALRREGP